MIPVAILAGGLGTRLKSIAGDLPKCLIPVLGRPFIAHQLEWLQSWGITDVAVLVGTGGDQVERIIGSVTPKNMNVKCFHDGPALRGTGGAVMAALPMLGESFLTLYGDSLLSCNVRAIAARFRQSDDMGLMTVYRNEDRWIPGNVRIQADRVTAYDKAALPGAMPYVDYGLNGFVRDAFSAFLHRATFDLSEVHRHLIARNALSAYPVADRFYEIGTPEGLAETEEMLAHTAGPFGSPVIEE